MCENSSRSDTPVNADSSQVTGAKAKRTAIETPTAPGQRLTVWRTLAMAKLLDVLLRRGNTLATLFCSRTRVNSSSACLLALGSYRAAAREKINHQNDECYDEQQVNQRTAKVA
jgi:hypothetical protein